jgi:hypothetical protein
MYLKIAFLFAVLQMIFFAVIPFIGVLRSRVVSALRGSDIGILELYFVILNGIENGDDSLRDVSTFDDVLTITVGAFVCFFQLLLVSIVIGLFWPVLALGILVLIVASIAYGFLSYRKKIKHKVSS